MPAAVVLCRCARDQVGAVRCRDPCRWAEDADDSTVQAARIVRREAATRRRLGAAERRCPAVDAIGKARAFASWLMVTGQLTVDAEVLGRVDLWLGNAARLYCPDAYRWFTSACARAQPPSRRRGPAVEHPGQDHRVDRRGARPGRR